MSMKNSSDTTENRTRDLPACRAVPQTTAPPRASIHTHTHARTHTHTHTHTYQRKRHPVSYRRQGELQIQCGRGGYIQSLCPCLKSSPEIVQKKATFNISRRASRCAHKASSILHKNSFRKQAKLSPLTVWPK